MRVIANTETSVRNLLQEKVRSGLMTQADADRLFRWGFRIVTETIANWRRREATPEAIAGAISRREQIAKTRYAKSIPGNSRHLAARDLILAQMFDAAWKGMQKDVAAYKIRV